MLIMFRWVIILFVLLSIPLRANLGETVEQCVKRYGKPIGFSEAGPKAPFGTMVFMAAKFTLVVFLLDTKEVGARVSKADKSAFTDPEMKTIMDADADPQSPWTSTPSTDPNCVEWTRGDTATVRYDKETHMLIFTSVAMAEAARSAQTTRRRRVRHRVRIQLRLKLQPLGRRRHRLRSRLVGVGNNLWAAGDATARQDGHR